LFVQQTQLQPNMQMLLIFLLLARTQPRYDTWLEDLKIQNIQLIFSYNLSVNHCYQVLLQFQAGYERKLALQLMWGRLGVSQLLTGTTAERKKSATSCLRSLQT
jgi:hypothetical protein